MLLLTLFSIATRCLGFIFKIYLTKIMTTTELGIYNLTLSVYMVIITLVGSSIPLTISKITANNESIGSQQKTTYSITSSLIMTTGFSVVICILLIMCKPLLTIVIGSSMGYYIILYLLPSILFTAMYSQIRGFLWGKENYLAVSLVEFLEQILRIIFCIICTIIFPQIPAVLVTALSLSVACGLSSLYGFFLYFKNGGKFKYKKGYFKPIISSTLPLTGVRLFGSLLQPLVAVLIPILLFNLGMPRDLALSQLGIIMGMTMPLLSIPSTIIGALCMILIPKININNKENLNSQIQNYIKFTITCSFVFIPIFISFSSPICAFVFDSVEAGLYMNYCCWIIIPLGICQISTAILNALNQEQKTFLYFIISSIIFILLVLIMPKYFGIKTMLIANGISYTIQCILSIGKIKQLTHSKTNIIKFIALHSLICIPVLILNSFCYNIFSKIPNTLITIMCVCIISVVIYLSLLFVFGIFDLSIVKEYILKLKKQPAKKQVNQ